MELFKKAFAGVTLAAMAVVTVAPAGFAQAAVELNDGDLIKGSSSAVYYYANNKRYVFPTESTFKTWHADFSKVKTISDDQRASIGIGTPNIVFKAGTNLVKITTDPKVYAVGMNGMLHHVATEAAAKTLWGNDWAKWVKDVPDSFFTNYKVSSTSLDGSKHVAGSVIKYTGSDKMYYITADGKKREFTGTAFADNGFMEKFVVTSPTSITYTNGDAISGKEKALWDVSQSSTSSAGESTETSQGNGMLSVALAADTPAGTEVPAGSTAASNIPFTKLNFTAGGDDVKVTKVKVKREGLSVDSDLSSVKLFDMDGNQVGTSQSFDAQHVASFLINWTVKAGTTQSLMVKADSANSKSGRIKLGLASADAVASNAKSVSGSFPIFGNTMEQADVSVGQLTISTGPSDPTGTTTVDIDDKDFRFMQVRLQAGSTEGAKIKTLSFREGDNSTVGDGDVTNVYLKDDSNNKKYEATKVGDRYVFNFSPAIMIDKGDKVDFSLRGDVVDGSGKVVTFALIEDSDWLLQADGAQYGYGLNFSPNASTTGVDFGSGTATDAETESFSISQGTLTVTKGANTPATGDIPLGGDDVKIASFDFEVRGEPIRVGSTAITLNETSAFDAQTDADLYKLVDADGKIWAGPFDAVDSDSTRNNASGATVTFSTQMVFPIGKTELFLTANVASTGLTAGTDKISASLTPSSALTTVKGMTSNKTVTPSPSSSVSANTMTVDSAELIVSMGANPITGTHVLGADGFHFATARLDATGGGEDVNLTSLTLGVATVGASIDMSDDFSNFKLYHDGKQIGETEQPTSSDTVVFNIDDEFVVPKNQIIELKMTMDLPSTGITAGQSMSFEFEDGAGVGMDSGVSVTGESSAGTALTSTNSNHSSTLTLQEFGQLKVTLDGNNPNAQVVASGSTDLEVARYKFRAEREDIDVTELNLYAGDAAANPSSAADSVSSNVSRVKVYAGDELLGTTVFSSTGTSKLKLGAGELRVPKDDDVIVKVVVDLAAKAILDSGTHMYVGLQDEDGDGSTWGTAGSFNMSANGVQSGTALTETNIDSLGTGSGNAAGGNKFALYDGILTVSLSPNSPSGNFSQGVGTEVLRLDLTATGDEIGVSDLEIFKSGSCVPDQTAAAVIESADGNTDYWDFSAGTAWAGADLETTSGTADATLTVGQGETKTIKFVADTGKATVCTDGQTLQYSVKVDDDGTANNVANGIEWYDQELTSSTPVTATDVVIKNLPVTGNVLEI